MFGSKKFISIAHPKSINLNVGTCECGLGLKQTNKVENNHNIKYYMKKNLHFHEQKIIWFYISMNNFTTGM